MTTVDKMAHECRNIAADDTGIVADRLPRNIVGSQTGAPLSSRSTRFKNLKLLKRLHL